MTKIRGVFALSAIVLFLSLAMSPATAQAPVPTQVQDRIQTTIDDIKSVQFTVKDMMTIGNFLPTLVEVMKTATSYTQLIDRIQNLAIEHSRSPVLVLFLNLLLKGIDFNFKISQLRPLRRTAFIMSWGFTNKFLALGKNKLNIVRPFTSWYYSGKSNLLMNSRTIILDLHPFSIRTLTGRQLGFMTEFIGFYMHRSNTIGDKAITFFFGHAQIIRGFDLSPFHN